MVASDKPAWVQEINNCPEHVAIIMDGNNRWAKKNHLPGVAGHKAGVEAIRNVLNVALHYDIKAITLFAFSSENWQRPKLEVDALMSLFLLYLQKEVKELDKNGVRIKVIGSRERFDDKLLANIEKAEALSADNKRLTLSIAADYGGQWDIINAAQILARKVEQGELEAGQIDQKLFDQATQLSDLPKPDLLIRTGGDHRISNFLLWQMAYTELYFTDTLWPGFDENVFVKAIADYSTRQRRFGRTSEQILQAKEPSQEE